MYMQSEKCYKTQTILMILVVIEGRFWRHVRFTFAFKFVSKLLNASKVHPWVPQKHYISCMERTIPPLYSSKTCFHRRLTVPHFSSIPFLTIYTFVAQLPAYIRPCMHTHIHKYIHEYMHIHMNACTHQYIHTCIHAYIHTYIHAYIHA